MHKTTTGALLHPDWPAATTPSASRAYGGRSRETTLFVAVRRRTPFLARVHPDDVPALSGQIERARREMDESGQPQLLQLSFRYRKSAAAYFQAECKSFIEARSRRFCACAARATT